MKYKHNAKDVQKLGGILWKDQVQTAKLEAGKMTEDWRTKNHLKSLGFLNV